MVSEGAPAHSGQPTEAPFQGCYSQALDLVTQEAKTLGEPIVVLLNSGTQWGPIDGTGAVSASIDADLGANTPGYVDVSPSGDEGTLPNHVRGRYSTTPAVFNFNKTSTATVYFQLWYAGAVPANVTLTLNDTGTSVAVAPGNNCANSADNSIELCTYLPGQQFYPWTSSGPDRAVWFFVDGHSGSGQITVQATASGSGIVDAYGDATIPTPVISYTNHSTLGRLTDYSSTSSAIVDGCFNVRTRWTDIDNNSQSLTNEGPTNGLWLYSSGGPTRDGRSPLTSFYGGVDITTPGGNAFAAYSPTSYWGDITLFPFNLARGSKGFYGRQSATSGSAPLLAGAVALLLQMNPQLTEAQMRQIIHQSAVSDSFTGTTPNLNWGEGKLNMLGAANLVAQGFNTNPALSTTSLTFPSQMVGTTSAAQKVAFSNLSPATDALGIASISIGGDFRIGSKSCKSSLAAGGQCTISIEFKPSATGIRTGSLTIKDFNMNSPHIVSLSGTGS